MPAPADIDHSHKTNARKLSRLHTSANSCPQLPGCSRIHKSTVAVLSDLGRSDTYQYACGAAYCRRVMIAYLSESRDDVC